MSNPREIEPEGVLLHRYVSAGDLAALNSRSWSKEALEFGSEVRIVYPSDG